jgi:hypothetical protein
MRSELGVNQYGRRGINTYMRGISIGLSLLMTVAATATVVTLSSPAVGSNAPAQYRYVEAEVFTAPGLGSVAVGMPNRRTVKIQHLDPATGMWDSPTVLYRKRGATCGEIEGRASAGGVALLLACTGYNVALVSRDLHGWSRTRLLGVHAAPAISPSGSYAAWLAAGTGGYVEWSAQAGFASAAATTYDYELGGETLVVDDAGTVSVLGPEPRGRDCVVGVHTRDLAGALTHSAVEGVDPGCIGGVLENVDALTVTGGTVLTTRADRFTLARSTVGTPWTLTRIRPSEAPGLVAYESSNNLIPTVYLETVHADRPLVAIGSPDRRRILTQVYDDAAQAWGPQIEAFTSGRKCSPGTDTAHRELYVFDLRCGRKTTVLVSADGRTWTVGKVGRRPWTLVGDQVALPDATGTTVISDRGTTRFPATTGRCGVAYPGRPGTLVRLYTAPGAAWPTMVQLSTGGPFRTVSEAPRLRDRCLEVTVVNTENPPTVVVRGDQRDHEVRFRMRQGTWTLSYVA